MPSLPQKGQLPSDGESMDDGAQPSSQDTSPSTALATQPERLETQQHGAPQQQNNDAESSVFTFAAGAAASKSSKISPLQTDCL